MSKLLAAYDRSRMPLYVQVASVIRQRIQSGHWAPGQKISTLEELGREFQVARVTVRQAIELLSDEGLLHARRGSGTFASVTPPDRHWLKLETSWASLVDAVRENTPKTIKLKKNAAPPKLRPGDGDLADNYVSLRSVQYREETPFSMVDLLLARHIFDRDPSLFMRSAALAALGSLPRLRVSAAHQTFVIGSADPVVADALKVALGAPTVECHCVVVDDKNVAIYVADIIYRSDCIRLQVDLLANSNPARANALPRTNLRPKRHGHRIKG